MGFWPLVLRVIKEADVVLLIIDARMPKLSKNSEIEVLANRMGKRIFYVYNKCDLLSNDNLLQLKRENPQGFFVSGTQRKGINGLRTRLLSLGKELGFNTLRVGVVGYPNVGKSVIINALFMRKVNKVSSHAGMTRRLKAAKFDGLRIVDTPGVIPFDDKESKLGLISAKNPEGISNPERVVVRIIELFLDRNAKALADFYKINLEGKREYEIFLEIGRKRGFLLKGGVVDEHRTAMQIIMDWQKGKILL